MTDDNDRNDALRLTYFVATRNKLTPNVRRILTSQKTFANHLADEEAALALQDQTPTVPSLATPRPSSSKTTPLQKRSSTSQLPTESAIIPQADETNQADIEMGGVDTGSTENIQINPLLKSYIPSAPSKAVMEALLLGPPLSYNAARAAPSSGKPQRRFCEMCGYWGTIKCLKCGARVCGLECRKQHGDGRCLFYA